MLLVLVNIGFGTTYYIDFDGGSDTNNGLLSSTAFKHCPGDDNATDTAGVTSLMPGDTVLFKGGVCYRGSITCQWSGSAAGSITYDGNSLGTFGTGLAVIDGSEPVTGWTQCQSADDCGGNPNWQNIYTTTVSWETDPYTANMYEDDQLLWTSQNPDLSDPFFFDSLGNYRPIHSDNVTRTSLTDPSYFTQSDPDYWNGAYIIVWGVPNIIRVCKITGYVPAEHKVLFNDTGSDSLYSDRTVYYATTNHLLHITVPGEYVVDEQTDTIYLWPRTGGDISQKEITVSRRHVGVNINGRNYITIDGLKIQKHTGGVGEIYRGIAVMDRLGGDHNVIHDNIMTMNRSIQKQGVIRMYGGCRDITVEDNYIYENPKNRGMILDFIDSVCRNNTMRKNGGTGIAFYGCVNSQMLGNTVLEHTGMHSNGLTLYLSCQNCLVAYNSVYDGHNALTMQNSSDLTFAYNILHTNVNSTTATDWGGCNGIYYYNNVMLSRYGNALGGSSTNIVARNNIIDGGAVSGNMSHNIYTSLSGGQTLGLGEILEEDKSKIFVDPNNRDFHLKADSPAIDAGIDLGFDRDKDGAFVPCNLVPDIGAYEYQYNCFVPPVGDFSRDSVVDFEDLKIMTDDWLASDYVLTGLVSRYKFDGNADDSVGSNDGTEVGGPTYAAGLHNQAINLDGSDDYVDCGSDVSFDITDSITLSAMIKGTCLLYTSPSPRD